MYSAAAAADLGGDEAGRQAGGQLYQVDRPPSASASLLPLAQRNDRNATRGFSFRRRNEAARCCAVNAPSQDKEAARAPAESALRTRKRSGSANYLECARLLAALRSVTQKETKYGYGALGVKQTGGVRQGVSWNVFVVANYGIYLSERRKRRDVPEGKCSLTGQLSTCKVALPPFLVKRTRWYLPSLMVVLVSFTLMSTVPMLKVTPTLPCSWKIKGHKSNFSSEIHQG